MASSFLRFLDHTQRRITVGRNPLDEWSARRRDLYLSTHNTHNRQTSIPPVGFEPTISAGELPQTYALDRATIGTGSYFYSTLKIKIVGLVRTVFSFCMLAIVKYSIPSCWTVHVSLQALVSGNNYEWAMLQYSDVRDNTFSLETVMVEHKHRKVLAKWIIIGLYS